MITIVNVCFVDKLNNDERSPWNPPSFSFLINICFVDKRNNLI